MKSLVYLIIGFSLFFELPAIGQPSGCTDPQAINYDSLATSNNGSCIYNPVSFSPAPTLNLPASLEELSGMVFWEGYFWGHNDSGNGPWFYAFDTLNGTIVKAVELSGATNIDWEDMAQDEEYIYIGDFGNNANGNRTNLTIYKFPKLLLTEQRDTIVLVEGQYELIKFSYPDQIDFTPTGGNNTKFDCEAMFFHQGKLHLITKNWVGDFSVHYTIPSASGTYMAERHDSLFTAGFMITAADIGAEDQILLTAYNRSGACSFFLIYGFDNALTLFETGNKRRINLPSAVQMGQLEAVCFINGIRGAIGSERFRFSVFDIPQNVKRFTTNQWTLDHYKRNSLQFAEAGMLRFNSETDTFEYFDGTTWISLSGE